MGPIGAINLFYLSREMDFTVAPELAPFENLVVAAVFVLFNKWVLFGAATERLPLFNDVKKGADV